jgi:hypothetical protein
VRLISFVVPGEARAVAQDPYSAIELRCCGVWVPASAGRTGKAVAE